MYHPNSGQLALETLMVRELLRPTHKTERAEK